MSLEQLERAIELPPSVPISPKAHHVLTILSWYARPDGSRAYPSVSTLSAKTRLARSTVQRALAELRRLGLAQVAETSVAKLPTCYRLTLPDPPESEAPHSATRSNAGPLNGAEGPHSEREGPQIRRGGASLSGPIPQRTVSEPPERARTREGRGAQGPQSRAPMPQLTIGQPAPRDTPLPSNRFDNSPRFPTSSNPPEPDATPPAKPAPRTSDPADIERRRREAADLAAALGLAPSGTAKR